MGPKGSDANGTAAYPGMREGNEGRNKMALAERYRGKHERMRRNLKGSGRACLEKACCRQMVGDVAVVVVVEG